MLNLTVLGRVDLGDVADRPLTPLLQRSKRLALLVRLVLARGDFVRRDQLLGLFWAESDEARARRALNQAVYAIRSLLGPDVVVRRGAEELGIADGSVWCDALAFEAALAADDPPGALALYEGEFLAGFYLDGCPGWQEWVDHERAALAARAAEAAWALAEAAGESGNRAAAVKWARRGVEISPFDEGAFRRLLGLLARAGDRAGALLEYERFARQVREAFDDEPDPETVLLAEEIRASRPASERSAAVAEIPRAAAGAEPPDTPPPLGPDGAEPDTAGGPGEAAERAKRAPAAAPPLESAPSRARTPPRVRWSVFGAVGLLLLVIAGAMFLPAAKKPPKRAMLGPLRIAVVPFDETGGGEQLHDVAGALTTAVAESLARVEALEVILDRGPHVSGAGHGVADTAGRASGVWMLVTGRVVGSGDNFRVHYTLVEASTGRLVMADTLERSAGELLPLVDEISSRIGSAVRVALGHEWRLERWNAGAADVDAGRLLQAADWQRARADTLWRSGSGPAAERALRAADSLAAQVAARVPGWTEPWVLRARIARRLGWLYLLPPSADTRLQRSYWERGIRLADSAIAINPREARAWEIRGVLRYMLWGTSVAEGRPERALVESARQDLERATGADRSLPRAWSVLSGILSSEGRFVEAREAAQQALSSDAFLEDAQEILLRLYTTSLDLGEDGEAARWCAEVRRRYPDDWTGAYCALGLAAWSDVQPPGGPVHIWDVIRGVRQDSAMLREVRPQLEMMAAAVLARRGESDSALAVIRGARGEGTASSELLRLEALARATLGDHAGANALVAQYARYDPTAPLWLPRSRAFRRARPVAGAGRTGDESARSRR